MPSEVVSPPDAILASSVGVFRALECRKAVDGLPGLPLRQAKLVKALKIQPEFRAHAEKMGEAKRRIAGNCPLPLQNRRDTICRHVELAGQFGGAHAEFGHFFLQVFAGVDWCLRHDCISFSGNQ
jgi:hypothetical protein